MIFAQKPAPVSCTYLAYSASTGLDTIDYRLSDPYLDPPGLDESHYSEKTIRLPETYWCYQPNLNAPPVSELPCEKNGFITFGCLNNFAKVSQITVAAWSRVLRELPTSRLIIHASPGEHRARLLDQFVQRQVDPARIQFAGFVPGNQYLFQYHQIDIALDTFPYGGGTTTCDALWMGVPVITLAGEKPMSRAGRSLVSNVGHPEWSTHSLEEFASRAVELAGDPVQLKSIRSQLREQMRISPLMDGPRFARNMESLFRTIWQDYCATSSTR